MTWFEIDYKCPACGCEWSDEWDSVVDADRCPACGLRHIVAADSRPAECDPPEEDK